MFACKCLVHTSHRTEFSAHGTSILMFRLSLIPDPFCRLRIHGTLPLCFPVQISSGLCHPVIFLSCSPHSFCNICRMCRNLRRHDSLFYIFKFWKCKVFCWCNISEECSTILSSDCSTDSGYNMVITWCNICYDWSKYIEWCSRTNGGL